MALLNNQTSLVKTQVGCCYAGIVHITANVAFLDGSNEAYRHMECYGSVLVWDAAMPQLKPVMDKYRDRQAPFK